MVVSAYLGSKSVIFEISSYRLTSRTTDTD
jgi:hypothetical protein